jgi:hypothetical protein
VTFANDGGIRHREPWARASGGNPSPLVVDRARGYAHVEVSIVDTPPRQIGLSGMLVDPPARRPHRRPVGIVALDKLSILPDTDPMIRFLAAQHFWFFGYPTILAAGGTRVI